jgi:hypothetical protein
VRRRLDDRGGHARADQHTLGLIIDMDAHRDPLGEPDPLEGWIGSDEELGAGEIVAIGSRHDCTVRASHPADKISACSPVFMTGILVSPKKPVTRWESL